MPSQTITNATISASSGDTTLVGATAGYRIRVLSYVLVASGTQTAKFQSSTTSDLTGAMTLIAGTPLVQEFQKEGVFETVAGELLNLNTSASTMKGHLSYCMVQAT